MDLYKISKINLKDKKNKRSGKRQSVGRCGANDRLGCVMDR